ncbi:ATP-binding protein [Prosthecobacter algae]|uniref:AAA family ATPase n=1 Tax=Prosthecobacter algae TaxID=1144682 RepID=UPI0031EA6DDA
MIISYAGRDDDAFRRNTEAIIRSLSVQNRASEARTLREALRPVSSKAGDIRSGQSTNVSVSVLTRQSPGLISFLPQMRKRTLVFPEQTQKSVDEVLLEFRASDKLAEAGLSPRRKLLFWGPPGCGKTATAQWLAAELGLPCGIVRLASLISSYVGETGANLQRVLQMADQTPMVLLLDEADAIAKSRDAENDVGEMRRVVNALLQGLDACTSRHSIVILASNHTHLFDEALWRRFDDVVEFPLPSLTERLKLLRHLTSGLKLKGSLPTVAKNLAGRSYAELERAVFEVAKSSILNERDSIPASEIAAASGRLQNKVSAAMRRKKPHSR